MKILLFLVCLTYCLSQNEPIKKGSSILKSIVLPGWGNLSAGNKTTGYIHMGAELTLWLGYVYNRKLRDNAIADYQNFARSSLNLNFSNYPSNYYETIASYNSYEQYKIIQLARGDNPNSLLPEKFQWQWDSDSERRFYNEKFNEATKFERNISLWFYGMAANRLISILTTNRDVKRANSFNATTKVSFNEVQGNQVNLNFFYSF